jgi:cyclopropane fatty-acyl-phospholipid synthase-like methyltransferase
MTSGSVDDEQDYRGFVGPSEKYDLISAAQFNLLTFLDLREDHYLLDIGCGSLRAGKLFIPFLLPGRYHGIEPEQWLIDQGLRNELGEDILEIKKPVFSNDNNFTLSIFDRKFDYILAHSIFSHASGRQISRCLSEARKVMKPTSLFIATFAKGDDNYSGDEGFVQYTEDHMRNLFEAQGLALSILSWPHPEFQVWIVAAIREQFERSENSEYSRLEKFESGVKEHQESLMRDREALFDLYFQRDE